jgi:rhodanese-related sulfurtransferase
MVRGISPLHYALVVGEARLKRIRRPRRVPKCRPRLAQYANGRADNGRMDEEHRNDGEIAMPATSRDTRHDMSDDLPSVTVREASARLSDPSATALLLDVRETDEYVPRRAAGAVNLPMSQLQRRLGEVPRDRELLVICEHGARSANVTRYLRRQGYTNVVNVAGGTDEWERQGLPMERL